MATQSFWYEPKKNEQTNKTATNLILNTYVSFHEFLFLYLADIYLLTEISVACSTLQCVCACTSDNVIKTDRKERKSGTAGKSAAVKKASPEI